MTDRCLKGFTTFHGHIHTQQKFRLKGPLEKKVVKQKTGIHCPPAK